MNPEVIFCQRCGQSNVYDSEFCRHCGASLRLQPSAAQSSPPASTPEQHIVQPAPQPPLPVDRYPTPVPRSRGSNALRTLLVIGVLLVCACCSIVLAVIIFGDQFNPQLPLLVTGTNTVKVASSQSGVVTSTKGARIDIPAGAVAPLDNGSSQTATFSIAEDSNQKVPLPAPLLLAGSVYRLDPEGFNFALPVQLTLPIPPGFDPSYVLGAVTLDPSSNTWKVMPATIDSQGRTVSLETAHFSFFGLFSVSHDYCVTGEEFSCKQQLATLSQGGGWIEVSNGLFRGALDYVPKGKGLPTASWYGVCAMTPPVFTPPAANAAFWLPPTGWKVAARDSESTKVWVPAATLNLIEFVLISEINNDPLYIPKFVEYWRPLPIQVLGDGQTLKFSYSSALAANSPGVVMGTAPCLGQAIPRRPTTVTPTPSKVPSFTATWTPKPGQTPSLTATRTATSIVTTTPSRTPTLTAIRTPTVNPQTLCACYGTWQKTIYEPQFREEYAKAEPDFLGWELRITKPWTYNSAKGVCVGSFETWRSLTWFNPPWQRSGSRPDAEVTLAEAAERCKEVK